MYDRVTFRLYRYQIGDDAFDGLRFFCKEGRNIGYMGNIFIKFEENHIDRSLPSQVVYVSGSIRKWFTSSNVVAPTFDEAVHEINEMCSVLGVDPQDASVTGLEFGSTYEVRKSPHRYMNLINSYRGTKRNTFSTTKGVETVNLTSNADKPGFALAFYDKGAEVLKKNKLDLGYFALRFEVKIFRGLRVKTKWKEPITLATLQDPNFFNSIKEYYLSKYYMINKLKEVQGNCKVETSLNGAYLFFARIGVDYLRTHPDGVEEYIKILKEENPQMTRSGINRTKGYIKKIFKTFEADNDNGEGLIEELDRLVRAECDRCSPNVQ